jgi:hypothetical protein
MFIFGCFGVANEVLQNYTPFVLRVHGSWQFLGDLDLVFG